MYINKMLWTDIESYRVTNINGKTATAVRVVKNPNKEHMQFIPGGFVGHYPNQHDAYRFSNDIVECGEPFQIEQHRGVWGRWRNEGYVFFGVSAENVERQKQMSEEMGDRCEAFLEDDGTYTIRITQLTKSGKPKRTFEKLGQLEEHCKYFYDHNF